MYVSVVASDGLKFVDLILVARRLAVGCQLAVCARSIKEESQGQVTRLHLFEVHSAAGRPRPLSAVVFHFIRQRNLAGVDEYLEHAHRLPRVVWLLISLNDDLLEFSSIAHGLNSDESTSSTVYRSCLSFSTSSTRSTHSLMIACLSSVADGPEAAPPAA